MNARLSVFFAGLVAATFSAGVSALPSTTTAKSAASPYPMDCAKWKDQARCAGFNARIAACRDQTDDAWLRCMYPGQPAASFTPPKPRNCSTAGNRELCETHSAAVEACKDKHTRAEHRGCMAERMQAASVKSR